jgi:hypothetical protein
MSRAKEVVMIKATGRRSLVILFCLLWAGLTYGNITLASEKRGISSNDYKILWGDIHIHNYRDPNQSDGQHQPKMTVNEVLDYARDTAIIVTTDHGFAEGGDHHYSFPIGSHSIPRRRDCYTTFMVCNKVRFSGDAMVSGIVEDIAATTYALMGIDANDFDLNNGLGIPAVPIWEREPNTVAEVHSIR